MVSRRRRFRCRLRGSSCETLDVLIEQSGHYLMEIDGKETWFTVESVGEYESDGVILDGTSGCLYGYADNRNHQSL